jgi:hypothetical protein
VRFGEKERKHGSKRRLLHYHLASRIMTFPKKKGRKMFLFCENAVISLGKKKRSPVIFPLHISLLNTFHRTERKQHELGMNKVEKGI